MNRCPLSYQPLPEGETYSREGLRRLHPRLERLDVLPWNDADIRREAAERMGKMSIQGVQPKVSLGLRLSEGRFDMVDRNGQYILKPAVVEWPHVPENEDLTMRLADAAGIDVPGHGLIRTTEGTLAFVIRRFDRVGRNERLALEDFAQLSGENRETKYNSSTERLVSVVNTFASFPAPERVKLFRRILFCFLTGNEDAHLKNWSFLTVDGVTPLSPAYDLLNTWLVLSNPVEELALPLVGKKSNLKRTDFFDYLARERMELNDAVIDLVCRDFVAVFPRWMELIGMSFLPTPLQQEYEALIRERAYRLGL